MPDITSNSRDLNYKTADIKVKVRNPSTNKLTTYTKTEILADSAVRSAMMTLMAVSASTAEARRTDYDKDGSNRVLDEDGNIYLNTFATGKALAYDTTLYNSVIFLDATA